MIFTKIKSWISFLLNRGATEKDINPWRMLKTMYLDVQHLKRDARYLSSEFPILHKMSYGNRAAGDDLQDVQQAISDLDASLRRLMFAAENTVLHHGGDADAILKAVAPTA